MTPTSWREGIKPLPGRDGGEGPEPEGQEREVSWVVVQRIKRLVKLGVQFKPIISPSTW